MTEIVSREARNTWQVSKPIQPFGGKDLTAEADSLPEQSLVQADNVIYTDKAITRDTGYSLFHDAVVGTPRIEFEHILIDGTSEVLLATNSRFYAEVNNTWEYVSAGVETTTTSNKVALDTTLDLTSAVGFSDGSPIGIRLDDGSQHQTTVSGAPAGNTITIADALPSACSIGSDVIVAAVLNGVDTRPVDMVSVPWDDKALFCNGVDPLQVYNPTTNQLTAVTGLVGNMACMTLTVYDNSIIAGNTTETGADHPNRVRWSDKGDYTNWTTGDAGSGDLYDDGGAVRAVRRLGPYCILYRDDSISRMELFGTTARRFNIERVVSDQGIISSQAVVDIGNHHILMGNDNFYSYFGGFELTPIGDKIRAQLFGTTGNLNVTVRSRIFAIYISETKDVLFFYTIAGQTGYPMNALRYNMRKGSWTTRSFPHVISGIGLYKSGDSDQWSELTGTWAEQTWTWDSASTAAVGSNLVLCSPDTGAGDPGTFFVDFTASTDDGTAITGVVDSKDFSHPDYHVRTDFVDVRYSGSSVEVYYSTDGGVSWTLYGTLDDTVTPAKQRLYKQIVGKTVRFRFQSSAFFSIFWYAFKFRYESEW